VKALSERMTVRISGNNIFMVCLMRIKKCYCTV